MAQLTCNQTDEETRNSSHKKGQTTASMAKTKQSRAGQETGTNNVYEVLVDRIIMGDYAPGVSLSEQELATELGISRTPVREALLRLRIEGLVRIVPRGGIFVAEPNLRRVREVTSMRLVLEEYLAHLVVDRRDELWLDKFADWLRQTKKNWYALSSRDWMRKDGEFHLLLQEASGDEVLAEHLGLLRRQAVLFWGQTTDGKASLKAIISDFEDFFAAVREGDTDACVQVLHRHVLAHVERIQTYLRPAPKSIAVSRVIR
jgi:DNA-binding GntR family transcriptional regulator